MNILCREMRRSLKELDLGLSGELQMSERMEDLFNALYLGRVPVSWSKLAYPSQRSFSSWMDNLIARAGQLQSWVEEPASIPLVVQITYMFNPQSFLTAIMQKTAQKQKLELDKLVIQTDVTRKTVEQTDTRARDGAYIYGLYMEGARWNWNAGLMEESLPREMSFALPVVCARAVLVDKMEKNGVYRCPVYKTQRRGDSYVFTAGLRIASRRFLSEVSRSLQQRNGESSNNHNAALTCNLASRSGVHIFARAAQRTGRGWAECGLPGIDRLRRSCLACSLEMSAAVYVIS